MGWGGYLKYLFTEPNEIKILIQIATVSLKISNNHRIKQFYLQIWTSFRLWFKVFYVLVTVNILSSTRGLKQTFTSYGHHLQHKHSLVLFFFVCFFKCSKCARPPLARLAATTTRAADISQTDAPPPPNPPHPPNEIYIFSPFFPNAPL